MRATPIRFVLFCFALFMVSDTVLAQRGADARRANLLRMMTPVDVELQDVRMEDFVEFMKSVTGADLEPYWESDLRPSGLVRDAEVSVTARNIPALDLMERVLERPDVTSDEFDEATWQMSPAGAFEFGPRSRLNRRTRTVIYDVRDLAFIFDNNQPPGALDLDSALDGGQGGGSGGGGGGGGLFGSGGGGGQGDDLNLGNNGDDILEELIDILVEAIEPDQWELTAGEGASLRVFRGDLLVRAPDYIHRQIDGYDWWPRNFVTRSSARVEALREHGYDAVADGTATYEPLPQVFDEDGVYVRVGAAPGRERPELAEEIGEDSAQSPSPVASEDEPSSSDDEG